MKANRILLIVIIASAAGCGNVEFEQYYNQGEVLYTTHCSNCHQKDGKGLGLLYPPLDKSDFMEQNFDEVLCIMPSRQVDADRCERQNVSAAHGRSVVVNRYRHRRDRHVYL